MPQLQVRDVDPELVERLKKCAASKGRSAEAEHQLILSQALEEPRKIPFSEALRLIPAVATMMIFPVRMMMGDAMYLIDTNVISELRKRGSANPGVHTFFHEVAVKEKPCYLPVVTVGEVVRGSAMIRHRGDTKKADAIDIWLKTILDDYATNILAIDQDVEILRGHIRVPKL